jgi:flagellin-specific chaperone FliS
LFSVFLETHPDHMRVWNEVQDNFLLQLLDTGLPSRSKKLTEMNEKIFDKWLKNQDFTKQPTPKYDIAIPVLSVKSDSNCQKSETLIHPLSLENNATTAGTAAIFEEFGKEFGIPCEHAKDYLPFDSKNQTFDLSAARTHHEFLASLKIHKTEMARTVQQLNEVEKAFNLPTTDLEPESTVSISTTSQQKVDAKFKNTFDNIVKRMWEAQQDKDTSRFDKFIDWLSSHRNYWENVKDHNGRTILHAAVENGNIPLVKTLVTVGVDINAKELCGATPLTIAVIND